MYYYITNPAAGRGAINQIQDKLRQRLIEAGINGEFIKTTGVGDATRLAKLAVEKGANTVVAVGGDGTVNEVINGITKDNVALGIIPIGQTNSLASHLSVPSWQKSIEILAARRLTSFGLIAAGQNLFLSTLSLGFETELDKQVDTAAGNLRARLIQFKQGMRHASDYQTLHCELELDGQLQVQCDIFSLSVANQKFLNPMAENKLIINITDKPKVTQLTNYTWQLIRGQKPMEDNATTRLEGDRVIIKTEPATGVMVDGKLVSRTPIAIRLTDRRIRIITGKVDSSLKP